MKLSASFFSVLLTGLSANAVVPYRQMESLRRQTVVVRVALDAPEDAAVKSCGVNAGNLATLGAGLSLAMDTAAERWQQMTLQEADLAALKIKIGLCEARGSCQVYEKFLSSVKTEEAVKTQTADLTKSLNQKLESMPASSYKKAFASVPEPCKVLKSILSKN